MRITQQLLRSKASGPLQSVEFLDLSNLGLIHIERLNTCPKLQALNLRGNSIVEITNLEQCRHLWKLDLSNNDIKDVDCLSKFICVGTLNLANNDLSWQHVGKLRHLHVLELSLHGNKQLEKDPYYRIHLIDCLPNVWMLDGRIVTSAERLQVKHFFADSAMTDHPIRRKLSKEWFVPSALKKVEVNGVYGEKATHLMVRFPANGGCNIETDRRRLKYLAHNAQEDLILEKKYTKRDYQVLKYRKTFVEDILEARPGDRERCNMLLLLLVSTLEFVMPTHLVKETLETAKLSKVGKLYAMDLFLLPKDIRCRIVCILLGAVKIDKDNKEDGGLYDKLYLCLFYTVAELSKLSNSIFGRNTTPKMTEIYKDYKCLLASEIVQLLCIVPAFFEYVDKDVGVMNLLVTATGDTMITEKIRKLSENVHRQGGDIKKLYEELSDFLLQKVQDQSLNLTNKSQKLPQGDQVITSMKSIPMKSPRSPLDASDFHAKGITSPNLDPPSILCAKSLALKNKKHFPHLGDYLLLGPQTLGKIIGLPQPFVAHVAMDSVPVPNGAMESKLKQSEDHYTYVNMDQLDWDLDLNFWKPRGSIGDSQKRGIQVDNRGLKKGVLLSSTVALMEPRHYIFRCKWFTIHTIEDLRKELNRRANLTGDQLPRPNSPEDTNRAFAMTPATGRDTSAPLIYSTTGMQSSMEDYHINKPTYGQHEYSPRPMTSLLKEKLDLKLDLTTRRTQSASVLERTSRLSEYSPRSPRNSMKTESVTHEDGRDSGTPDNVPTECVHCAMQAALNKGDDSDKTQIADHVHEYPTTPRDGDTAQQTNTQIAQQSVKDNNKENEVPETSRTDMESLAHSDDEPELQSLVTERSEVTGRPEVTQRSEVVMETPGVVIAMSERPASAPQKQEGNQRATPNKYNTSYNSLQINIPQVPLMEGGDSPDDRKSRKGKVPVIKGRQPFSSRSTVKTGKLSMQGNQQNRPYSAMDAYRYILNHPRKPIGSEMYNTSYQEQRTEAWRQSATTTSASSTHTLFEVVNPSIDSGNTSEVESLFSDNGWSEMTEEIVPLTLYYSRQGTPPPQRPTSPDNNKTRPNSALSVTKASDWLGGGRDLHWETLQKRPMSGHVPGWKEGLPDSMKRPRSAVAARTLSRQNRRSAPVTPSSLAYEAMMQAGGRGLSSPRTSTGTFDSPIPNMMNLAEYQPLYHHLGLPRRLGSAGGSCGSQEYSPHQTQDTVYRMPPSSPQVPRGGMACISPGESHRTPVCMHSIYEDIDEEVSSHYSDFHYGRDDTTTAISQY